MPIDPAPNRRIVVDGSNLATEGRSLPSLAQLEEAIQADANYALAYVALSKTLADGFSNESEALAKQALEHDTKCFQAHELLAYLALENGNDALAAEGLGLFQRHSRPLACQRHQPVQGAGIQQAPSQRLGHGAAHRALA